MLAIFVTVIIAIATMNNIRFASIDTQLVAIVTKLNSMSNTATLNDYATKRDFEAIKNHFNIVTPDTLPETGFVEVNDEITS